MVRELHNAEFTCLSAKTPIWTFNFGHSFGANVYPNTPNGYLQIKFVSSMNQGYYVCTGATAMGLIFSCIWKTYCKR